MRIGGVRCSVMRDGFAMSSLRCFLAVPPNHAFERTREKRPWLRNDHRCARAAQRERWAAIAVAAIVLGRRTATSMSHSFSMPAPCCTLDLRPEMSPPLAGEAASLLTLNCQPIRERATTTINTSSGCTRSRARRLGGPVPALPARSQQSSIGVVFMACSLRFSER